MLKFKISCRAIRAWAVLCVGLLAPSATLANIDSVRCPTADTRLVVLGDSLADGLWGSLYRGFARCPSMDIVRLTRVSDGLTRTDAKAWLARYAKAAPARADQKVNEVVIVQIGANDITFLRNGSKRASFGTDDWLQSYSSRAKELAQGLSGKANAVIWFGLPIVGSARLEPSYQQISNVLQAGLSGTGAAFVDIHGLTKFGGDAFAMNAKVNGRVQQMRASDQIHFTTIGYDQVLGAIAGKLDSIFAVQERSATLNHVELQ